LAKLVSGWLPPWLHHKILKKKNPGMNKITPQGSKRETSPRGNDKQVGFCENGIRYPASGWYPHMLSQHEMSMLSQHGMSMLSQHGMRKIATFFPHFFLPNFSSQFWMKTITGNS